MSRRQNLPSILRGIASDEQIRTVFDLQAINEAADEIERLRIEVAELEEALAGVRARNRHFREALEKAMNM